jgi:hypothetical protein
MISLYEESLYLQGARDLLLRLDEMKALPQFHTSRDTKQPDVYNRAVMREILHNMESLVRFLQGDGWRYCDHQTDKKGRLIDVKVVFNN